jgi:two-component system chemotaxis response regulator CheY
MKVVSKKLDIGDTKNMENEVAKLLIAEDHSITRSMVQAILKSVGFNSIDQADSGMNALRKLAEFDYDLVICDWNMPEPKGIDVLRRVRASDKNQNVLFLMLTAEAYRENVEEAKKHGVSGYVIKPFTAETLLKEIARLLKTI